MYTIGHWLLIMKPSLLSVYPTVSWLLFSYVANNGNDLWHWFAIVKIVKFYWGQVMKTVSRTQRFPLFSCSSFSLDSTLANFASGGLSPNASASLSSGNISFAIWLSHSSILFNVSPWLCFSFFKVEKMIRTFFYSSCVMFGYLIGNITL